METTQSKSSEYEPFISIDKGKYKKIIKEQFV